MIYFTALVSYVVHVFLCRWILKKAYQLNNDEYVKELIIVSFFPFVGLVVSIGAFCIEYRYSNGTGNTWFTGKNW